ncbi:AAA family ATPase [Microbacterium sp. NPDC096154]|uniref:ATP-dependent nuclease n=1 Tax=Microbacterium sp. NPDC096154 TaxID=3155549 RepID=UPI00332E4F0E
MRLNRLKVENHRRLQDVEIEIRDHLVLVGPNDVGKSSLLRCLDLVLGASTAQLYSAITADDFRDAGAPFAVEVELTGFSEDEKALFPDEATVDPVAKERSLIIRLSADIDENDTVSIARVAPHAGHGRQLSRDQLAGLGWKFLSATSQTRDLREGRKTPVDELLATVELGSEKAAFEEAAEQFQKALTASEALGHIRDSLAAQLSKALPKTIGTDDLSFVSGASAEDDLLSDVRLQVAKDGEPHALSEQSDGTRAMYAIALYDLMSVGANVVGIDEPEVHLHPTGQRTLARLLRDGANQKVIATHSSDIVGAFDPDSILTVKPGGRVVQPTAGFLSSDERMFVRWWVRDRLEPLTARRVVAVEGTSDRVILERAAEVTNRQLDRLGVSVLEVDGSGEMGPVEKLFGPNGFDIPMSLLIDEDAESDMAKHLGVPSEELNSRSVWVSRKDLEAEYVAALGPEAVQEALAGCGYFSATFLRRLQPTGEGGEFTAVDVAGFCRLDSKTKVRAALAVAPLLTAQSAAKIQSIESLLSEIAE